jgi:hypothetical protein
MVNGWLAGSLRGCPYYATRMGAFQTATGIGHYAAASTTRRGRMLPEEVEQRALPVLKRHDVVGASVFGSFAGGEADADSDLDIPVELPSTKLCWTLWR